MPRQDVFVVVLIAMLVSSCAATLEGGGTGDGVGSGADGGTGDGGSGGGTRDSGPVDREAFCMGGGPVVTVGDPRMGTDTCAGAIASRVFDHSLCSCEETNVVGYLHTRSFHSGDGVGETAAGGPVGINGEYLTGGYADIGGTFVVAGRDGIDFGGYLKVGGDARFGGDVEAVGYIEIGRDLHVTGDVNLLGLLSVDRDLYHGGRLPLVPPNVGGSRSSTSVSVDPPCACAPSELVDIAAIVAAGVLENDNADVDLDPHLLENVVGLGVDITLPCGRYYLTSIGGLGTIDLHIPGRTALFVDGDVDALGAFNIDLGPEGELDLFIRGNLVSIGAGSFGDRSRPAGTRVYVGGDGDVTLVGASGFVGNVYAPRAVITAVGATKVYGSLFGRQIQMPGFLEVSYDRAILDVDEECPTPGICGCGAGDGCPDHRACLSGMCEACSSDADCCGDLVCYADGSCGPLLI